MSRLWSRVREAVRGAVAESNAAAPAAVAAAAPKPLGVAPTLAPATASAVVNDAALAPSPLSGGTAEPAASAAGLDHAPIKPSVALAAPEPGQPLMPPSPPPPQPRVISERDALGVLAGALDRCDDEGVYIIASGGRAPLRPPPTQPRSEVPAPNAPLGAVAADALRYSVLLAAAPRASSSTPSSPAPGVTPAASSAPQVTPGAVAAALTAALALAARATAAGSGAAVAPLLADCAAALAAQLRPRVVTASGTGSGDAATTAAARAALRRLWPPRRLATCYASCAQLRVADDALLALLSDALVVALEDAADAGHTPPASDAGAASVTPPQRQQPQPSQRSSPPLPLDDAAALLRWVAAGHTLHGPLLTALAHAAGAALPPPPRRVDPATGAVIPWDPPLPSAKLAALAGACASLAQRLPDARAATAVMVAAAAPALLCWVRAAQEDGDRGVPLTAHALASAAQTAAALAALPASSAAADSGAVKVAVRASHAFYEWAGRSHLAMPPARSRVGGAAATSEADVPAAVAALQAAMAGWHPALLTATAAELSSQRHRGRIGTVSVALLSAVAGEVSARLDVYDSLYLDGWHGGLIDASADDSVSPFAAWRQGSLPQLQLRLDEGAEASSEPASHAIRSPTLERAAASEQTTAQHDVTAYRRLSGRVSVTALASVAAGWGPGVDAPSAAPSFVAAPGTAGGAPTAAARALSDDAPPALPESPLHLAASLAARPSSPPLAPLLPPPTLAASTGDLDLPAHQHTRFGPAALASLAAVYAGAGHHHHGDAAAAAALSPLAVGAAVVVAPTGAASAPAVDAAAVAAIARQADGARRALAGAAATLLQRVGDAAVAYAVTGESALPDEVALLHAYASAGVPHRGMVAALARRLAAKGSVGRLAALADAEVARALAALAVGWAFTDADAVAVLVRELRDRWRASERTAEASAASAAARPAPTSAAPAARPSAQQGPAQRQPQQPRQQQRTRSYSTGRGDHDAVPSEPSHDGGGDIDAPPPPLPAGRSLAGRVWSSLSRPFAAPFDTRHLTLAVPPDEHWSRELSAWEPLFGRGGGGKGAPPLPPLPASPTALPNSSAAAAANHGGSAAVAPSAPPARAYPLRHLELGPDDAAALRLAVATLSTASPFPHFVAELPPALLRALGATGPSAAAAAVTASLPGGPEPVPPHPGYAASRCGPAVRDAVASAASPLPSNTGGYEAGDSGSASGSGASSTCGSSSSSGGESSSGASGSDTDGTAGAPTARRRSGSGNASGSGAAGRAFKAAAAAQLAAEKSRRDAAAALAAADGSLRPLLQPLSVSPYDVLGLVEAVRRALVAAADDAARRVADADATAAAATADDDDGVLSGTGGRPFTRFLSASEMLQSALAGRRAATSAGSSVGDYAPLTPDTVYSDERDVGSGAEDDDEAVGVVGEATDIIGGGSEGGAQSLPSHPPLLDLACGLDGAGRASDGDRHHLPPPAVAAALPGLRAALLARGSRLSCPAPATGSGRPDAPHPPLVAAWYTMSVPTAPGAGPGAPPVATLLLPLALPAHRVALELRGPHDELLPPLPLLEAVAAANAPLPTSVPSLGAMWRHALLTQAGWAVVPLRLTGFGWAPAHPPGSQKSGLALADGSGAAVTRALAAQLPPALLLPPAGAASGEGEGTN